jgi:hypothetical protein
MDSQSKRWAKSHNSGLSCEITFVMGNCAVRPLQFVVKDTDVLQVLQLRGLDFLRDPLLDECGVFWVHHCAGRKSPKRVVERPSYMYPYKITIQTGFAVENAKAT